MLVLFSAVYLLSTDFRQSVDKQFTDYKAEYIYKCDNGFKSPTQSGFRNGVQNGMLYYNDENKKKAYNIPEGVTCYTENRESRGLN